MWHPAWLARSRAGRVLTAAAVLVMWVAAPLWLDCDPAAATSCGGAVAAGSSCALTGTLTVSGGLLTLSSPSALAWSVTLNGTNQSVYDPNSADQSYVVNDATGSGAGWNVTVSATTFSSGSHTLANSGTLSTNGSLSSATATTAPTAACYTGATCALPADTTTYPVAITTAASSPAAVKVYDDSAGAGMGEVTISSIGWWVTVPANTLAGTYTSTLTLEVNSGP